MSTPLVGDSAATQLQSTLDSHPLAGPPSPDLLEGSNTPSTSNYTRRLGTVRGAQGTLRPNDYGEVSTGSDEEDEQLPPWLHRGISRPSSRAAARQSLFSAASTGRGDTTGTPPPISQAATASQIYRPNSRASSVRSPTSLPRRPPNELFADLDAAEAQDEARKAGSTIPFGDRQDGEDGEELAENSLQLLCSLRLMTDEDVDRHKTISAKRKTSTSQRPPAIRTASAGHLRKGIPGGVAAVEANSSTSQVTEPYTITSNSNNNLVRELSHALTMATEQAKLASKAHQQALRRQGAVLAAQQKRSEAREAALKDIMLSMGVSQARITRALTHASAQAEVPVFRADERLADHLMASALQTDTSSKSLSSRMSKGLDNDDNDNENDDDEQLPHSLREAMLEDLEGGLNIKTSSSDPAATMTPQAAKTYRRDDLKARTNMSSSRSQASSLSPDPSERSGKSNRPFSPSSTQQSRMDGAQASNNFGWASNLVPWGSGGATSKKAAASVQAHSPAAVEADGYLSDGAGFSASPPRSPTPRRPHTRSASISAMFSGSSSYGDTDADAEDLQTPVKAPSSSSANSSSTGAMGFGLLGSLAWRRKKPSKNLSGATPPTTAAASLASKNFERSEPASPVSQFAPSSFLDNESVVETLASDSDTPFSRENNQDTIKAKAPLLRPQPQYTLSGRDVSTALHEATETMSVESQHRQLATSPQLAIDRVHPTHFKAVFLATRIMTSDPASLLLDSGRRTSELVASLALNLVGRAREEGIVVEEKSSSGTHSNLRRPSMPSRPPSRTTVFNAQGLGGGAGLSGAERSATEALKDIDARPSPPAPMSSTSSSSTAATLGRALGKYRKSMYNQQRTSTGASSSDKKIEPNVTRLPQMFGLSATQTTASEPVIARQNNAGQDSIGPAPSVELEPILPNDIKPPTLAVFQRRSAALANFAAPRPKRKLLNALNEEDDEDSSGDEFEVYGGKGLVTEPAPEPVGSRIQDTSELLTDRYGFVYDATPADVRLLRRARRAATPAPACLTGIRVGVSARGGEDSQSDEADKDEGGEADEADDSDEAAEEDAEGHIVHRESEAEAQSQEATKTSGEETGGSDESDVSNSGSLQTSSSRKTAGTSTNNGILTIAPSKPVAQAYQLSVPSQMALTPGPTSPEQEREMQFGNADQADSSAETASVTRQQGRTGERPHSTSQTVKRLLGQLQEMHETQQSAQQAQWDDFLQRRRENMRQRRGGAAAAEKEAILSGRKPTTSLSLAAEVVRKGSGALGLGGSNSSTEQTNALVSTPPAEKAPEEDWSVGLVGFAHLTALVNASSSSTSQSSGAATSLSSETASAVANAAGPLAIQRAKADLAEFQRLVQGGIPLVYRSKIWVECSGANEVAEPGRYQELLDEHEGERNQCTDQIDLDVGRTMPTNVYFGGEGPGVAKLRKLLVAFSWYNPRCGYCQGMNNLAATLLLTHSSEEEAFWVMVCIIERILPAEYYTSHLLVSQADQRVLIDLVDELLPRLSAHVQDLGVDLPAVTFAWFLSLYTDCLPVETLFRVWDLLFVEGNTILFRVALAILVINEDRLLAADSAGGFYGVVHSMTSHLFAVDRLVLLACGTAEDGTAAAAAAASAGSSIGNLRDKISVEKVEKSRRRHVEMLAKELGLEGAIDGESAIEGV